LPLAAAATPDSDKSDADLFPVSIAPKKTDGPPILGGPSVFSEQERFFKRPAEGSAGCFLWWS
jgi:hypothetical protein